MCLQCIRHAWIIQSQTIALWLNPAKIRSTFARSYKTSRTVEAIPNNGPCFVLVHAFRPFHRLHSKGVQPRGLPRSTDRSPTGWRPWLGLHVLCLVAAESHRPNENVVVNSSVQAFFTGLALIFLPPLASACQQRCPGRDRQTDRERELTDFIYAVPTASFFFFKKSHEILWLRGRGVLPITLSQGALKLEIPTGNSLGPY